MSSCPLAEYMSSSHSHRIWMLPASTRCVVFAVVKSWVEFSRCCDENSDPNGTVLSPYLLTASFVFFTNNYYRWFDEWHPINSDLWVPQNVRMDWWCHAGGCWRRAPLARVAGADSFINKDSLCKVMIWWCASTSLMDYVCVCVSRELSKPLMLRACLAPV